MFLQNKQPFRNAKRLDVAKSQEPGWWRKKNQFSIKNFIVKGETGEIILNLHNYFYYSLQLTTWLHALRQKDCYRCQKT